LADLIVYKELFCFSSHFFFFQIMVLGKEGVGKTHIFHLCSGSLYPRDASTDGIDIHSFSLFGEDSDIAPVTWFDFGGQEVFYPTHELFLTGQCVYLLVFKMTEAEYAKRVVYWLKVVTSFSLDRVIHQKIDV
jgi:GTPase SAR1 family protein